MKNKLPSAVLWDMDGTLIDQSASIIRCYSQVITAMGYPQPSDETIKRSMGGPMASTMALFVNSEQLDEACCNFRERFPKIMFDGLVVLPGSEDLIEFFSRKSIPQAICTNKHGETARRVSEHCGFSKHVPICIGNTDTKWAKPQPELTHFILQEINAETEGTILIGDSPTDVETALNANIECYAVTTGAHTEVELLDAGAAQVYPNLSALLASFD